MLETRRTVSLNKTSLSPGAMQALVDAAWPEARKRAGIIKSKRYQEFQQRYYNDPVAFANECIRWPKEPGGLKPYQADVLNMLVAWGRTAVRSLHGVGKTGMCAIAVHWYALTRDGQDWKILTTASKWRQLTLYLWPEIHKWSRALRWSKIGRDPYDDRTELFNLQLKLSTGSASAMATNDPTAIEGAHADHMFYLFDESKSIPDEIFDAAEGAFATSGRGGTEAFALAVSTPGEPRGRFYDIHKHKPGFEDWKTRHITLAEALAAEQVTEEWVERRAIQWGRGTPIFLNRVEGEFAENQTQGIITIEMVDAAVDRWNEWVALGRLGLLTHIGVDVGRGANESVVSLIYDNQYVGELRKNKIADLMHTTGIVAGLLENNPQAIAIVDVIGIGAGVVDRLRELFPTERKRIIAFNASEGTKVRDKTGELGFVDKRSAAWWKMRESLMDNQFAFPEDEFLFGELTAPQYTVTSSGKIKVESKESIRDRGVIGGRSTDSADSVIQGFLGESLAVVSYSWGLGASK